MMSFSCGIEACSRFLLDGIGVLRPASISIGASGVQIYTIYQGRFRVLMVFHIIGLREVVLALKPALT